jgi:hypothetical protein
MNSIRISGTVQIIPIEILAVVISIATLFTSRKNVLTTTNRKYLKFVDLFCLISLSHQWFTDTINSVIAFETLKSIAQVLVLWALLRIAVIFLQTDVMRFIYYVVGLLMSVIVQFLLSPTIYISAEPWKFALGPVSTSIVFILATRASRKTLLLLGATVLIILDLLLGARSLALFTLLTLILTSIKIHSNRKSLPKYVLAAISITALLFIAERAYFSLSTNGTLGIKQQSKALDQYAAGPILLTARSEIPFQLAAIKLNPIIGVGSSPQLTYELLNETQIINSKLGVETRLTNSYKQSLTTGKFPEHSMIFAAWIESGLIVFLLWVIILLWVIKRISESIANPTPPLGYYAMFMGISTLWAILFSPLGAGSRMYLAVGLTALFLQSRFKQVT